MAGDLAASPLADAPVADVSAAAAPRVEFAIELARPDGSLLTSLAVGEEFVVRVLVEDLRESADGVFAAYVDVEWDADKAISTGIVRYGEEYYNGRHASVTTPGLIDEAGAFAALEAVGGGRLELFSATLRATAPGVLAFKANPADVVDVRDVLTFGPVEEPSFVPDEATVFRGAAIVVAEAPAPVAAAPLPVESVAASAPATVLLPISDPVPAPIAQPVLPVVEPVPAAVVEALVVAPESAAAEAAPAATLDDVALSGLGLLALLAETSGAAATAQSNPAAKALLALDAAGSTAEEAQPAIHAGNEASSPLNESSVDEDDEAALLVDDSDSEDGYAAA